MSKSLSPEILIKEATFLAELLIDRYSSEEGAIFERVEAATGKVVNADLAIDELGDYIQYVIYLGNISSRNDFVSWGLDSLKKISMNYQMEEGLYDNRAGENFIHRRLLTLENADTITGLVSSYLFTKNESLRPVIEKFIEGTLHHFNEEGYLIYGYLFGNKLRVPLASLLFSAYFIEEVLIYMETTGNWCYLPRIREIIGKNLSSSYYVEHGIFQARIPLGLQGTFWKLIYRFLKKDDLKTTFLVKDNLYFLFALLKYFSTQKDIEIKVIIKEVYNRLLKSFETNKTIYNKWHPERGAFGDPSPLALSHSLIELQLDLYHEFSDEMYLEHAVDLADKWLQRKSSQGIVAESQFSNDDFSLLDSNVDFSVNLMKLYEKTGKDVFREAAFNIVRGIVTRFKLSHGYCWAVATETGQPLQTDIESKYLGLLIKIFLVLFEYLNERRIFEDPLLRNLARDR